MSNGDRKRSPEYEIAEDLIKNDEAVFGKPDELEVKLSDPGYIASLPYRSRRYLAVHGKDEWLLWEKKRLAEEKALKGKPSTRTPATWLPHATSPFTQETETGYEQGFITPDSRVWLGGEEVGSIGEGGFAQREPTLGEGFMMGQGVLEQRAKNLYGEVIPEFTEAMWREMPFNPYYYKTPEEKARMRNIDTLTEWAQEQGIPNAKQWVMDFLAEPEEGRTLTMGAVEEEPTRRLPYAGEKAEFEWGTPGERLVGEWIGPGFVLSQLPTATAGWKAASTLPKAAQIASKISLAPLYAAEQATGAALKYGVLIPITKGIPAGGEKILQLLLDTGIDRWIATQGRLTPEAQSTFAKWIIGNRSWLIERATQNMLNRMGKTGTTAEQAAQQAVQDTLKEAEPLLLKAGNVTLPKAEPGMPEAGLQPSMVEGVAAREVFPAGKGKVVQVSLDDFAKLQSVNAGQVTNRITQIQSLLATEGRLPAGKGARAELEIELARLEAQAELSNIQSREQIETTIQDIQNELGNRSMPYHGGATNLFPEYNTRQLDEQLRVFEDALAGIKAPPISLSSQVSDLYNQMQVEVGAMKAAIQGMRGGEAQSARSTLKALERELKVLRDSVTKGRPVAEDAGKLRQTIMAWAKFKGIPQTQLRGLFKSKTGVDHLTKMTRTQLGIALNAVKGARPVRVGGKRVITNKTEGKIKSLREALVSEGKITREYFKSLVKELNLKTTGYVNANRFITESEGRGLIRAMNDEAIVGYIARESEVAQGLENHPEIKAEVDKLSGKIANESQVFLEGKPVGASPFWDMRYYTQSLEAKTGAPFYKIWQMANKKHLENRLAQKRLWTKIGESTPEFDKIAQDNKALQRVSDYIAAKNKFYPVKSPLDITPEEIKLANALEDTYFGLAPDVRYYRFLMAYEKHGSNVAAIPKDADYGIPDAPVKDLRAAVNVYESKGAGALRAYLDTKTWGVIDSGYEPHIVVNPKLALRKMKSTVFGKSHLKSREGLELLPSDENIVQRTNSYIRQILNLNLQPYFRRMDTVFSENASKLGDPFGVSKNLSYSLNEMKGYIEQGGPMTQIFARLMGQAYATVFLHPSLAYRNLFQNVAFHPDRSALINPSNRKLTEQERVFFNTYISQMERIAEEYMLGKEKPLPGLDRLTKLARRWTQYGKSDQVNRLWGSWASLNKAERALKSYKVHGDIKKFSIDSGLNDLTLAQQKEILGLMSLERVTYGNPDILPVDGETAAIREIAKEITNNVHFLYERAQRAPVEMGGMGRTFGSLLVFSRSYVQRMYLALKDIAPGAQASGDKKLRAWKIFAGNILFGYAASYVYQKTTGKSRLPYDPLNIISWTPGGLAVGVAQDVGDIAGDILLAGTGDKDAMYRLTSAIPAASNTLLPLYRIMIDCVEASLDVRYIDRLALRKIRELLDKEYEANPEFYTKEREWWEKLQHAIFGGEAPDPDPTKTAVSVLTENEALLGQYILGEDGEPFYYELTDLAAEIRSQTFNLPPDEITKENGFSDLTLMYLKAEHSWDNYYYSLPASQRATFRESDSEIAAQTEAYLFVWGKLSVLRNPRSRAIVEQLIKDYKIPDRAVPALE